MSNLIIPGGTPDAAGHQIGHSLIFDGTNERLYKYMSASEKKRFTLSAWVKRDNAGGARENIWAAGHNNYNYSRIRFESDDDTIGSGGRRNNDYNWYGINTAPVFDSTSVWYHIVLAFDAIGETGYDEVKLWVDGVQDTTLTYSNSPENNGRFNLATGHWLGCMNVASVATNHFDGKMAECVMIDDEALDHLSFGEFSGGVWRPIDLSGLDYSGSNSYHLDFEDGASTTTLGYDVSGNANHFALQNMSTANQSTDTPTS